MYSKMSYLSRLEQYSKSGKLPPELAKMLHPFYFTYADAALSNGQESPTFEPLLVQFLDCVIDQIAHPFLFEPYHQKITQPFDFYHFGLDFIRPLIIMKESKVLHRNHLKQISEQINRGENVILLSNHQTELDPQVISLLLEKDHPRLAEEMIFVAGHRVTTDPLAVPFSKGRNLLCIYSKKYIEDDPASKEDKLLHNQRTMMRMSQLLSEGSKCIFVAPSGGRDRPGRNQKVEVAPFDPQSIEMFWLMAQRSACTTHFYPLALATYNLLPPPDTVKKKLGETRHTQATATHLAFGPEINMDSFPGSANLDKKQKRKVRAQYIWEQVRKDYLELERN